MFRHNEDMPPEYQELFEHSETLEITHKGADAVHPSIMYRRGINVPLEEMHKFVEFKQIYDEQNNNPVAMLLYQENDENRITELFKPNGRYPDYTETCNQAMLFEAATKGYSMDIRTDNGLYEAKLQYRDPEHTLNPQQHQSFLIDLVARPKGSDGPYETVDTKTSLGAFCSTDPNDPTKTIQQTVNEHVKTKEAQSDFPSLDDLKSRAQSTPHKDMTAVESTSEKATSLNPEVAKETENVYSK